MYDELYLIVIKNPFEKTPFVFASNKINSWILYDLTEVSKYSKVISYRFEELIDEYRRKQTRLPEFVIDIVTIKKLCYGKPNKEIGKKVPWELVNLLGG